jgi:hypothetical protein
MRKDDSEHVFSQAPAIIAPADFERVQSILKARNPKVASLWELLSAIVERRATEGAAVDGRLAARWRGKRKRPTNACGASTA